MNRRSLLAFIGLAPIAGAAAALPRVADPVKLASTGGREVTFRNDIDVTGITDDVLKSLNEQLGQIQNIHAGRCHLTR